MLLKLENIGKIYNSNDLLVVGIRGINLEFDYNEFVTIEGESGGGKSTLLNVIGANDTYEEGELWFNGEETSHYSKADWELYREHNIATIFQDFNVIDNLTVVENVELALLRYNSKKERRSIALDLIKKVGLEKQAHQKASKLSGGEKQRTVIARALAKDSPIILADEPTGNLDVKASKEVAKLLKDVSKDKLIIVVTHNPEFFKEYATRRVRVFDGAISEDEVVSKPETTEVKPVVVTEKKRFANLKNILHIGSLNYKSRPKFTTMMSLALLVCAVTLFMVITLFGDTLIKPLKDNIDYYGVPGKVILSSEDTYITEDELDLLSYHTGAGFFFLDKSLSEFKVEVPKTNKTLSDYEVLCLFDPYQYNLEENEGVLLLPKSYARDKDYLVKLFKNANVNLENIVVKEVLDSKEIKLYLGYESLRNSGKQIKAINSLMKLGENKSRAYKFMINDELQSGTINLINSTYWNVIGKTVVFDASGKKSFQIVDDTKKDKRISGLAVEMSQEDYDEMFNLETRSKEACLYFSSDDLAEKRLKDLPAGFMGMLSTRQVYKQNAGDLFTSNIVSYLLMIGVSILFGAIISIIFMRSVKIFETDFAVYKTLGIPSKVAYKSLYVQMFLIFLPTLVFLPLISLIATIMPGSSFTFITGFNFCFIEIMLLMIVELVAFGFNKSLNQKSIRKTLTRGSK